MDDTTDIKEPQVRQPLDMSISTPPVYLIMKNIFASLGRQEILTLICSNNLSLVASTPFCSKFPTFLTMMVFANTIKLIDALTFFQDLRLWRMCYSGGIFQNPNFCVRWQYNGKYIDTPPYISSIRLLINFYLKNDFS